MKDEGHVGICWDDIYKVDQLGAINCELCLELVGMELLKGKEHMKCERCKRDGVNKGIKSRKESVCPFQAEIWGNYDAYCTCCDDCAQECHDNI